MGGTDGSTEAAPSFLHLLVVWLLVGGSLFSLGEEILGFLSVSRMSAGLLFGTLVVCTLWVVGFRPSIRASVAYFILEIGCSALLFLPVVTLFGAIDPGVLAVFEATTVAVAAVVVFTPVGPAIRDVVRRWATSLLRLPTGTDAR